VRMKRTGGILATAALLAALTACSSMEGAPETAPTTPAAEAPTQEPTTEAPTEEPPVEAPPVEEPTTHDGVDLAANYPDADTRGFINQYRSITTDTTTPDDQVITGGYELCWDMDLEGVQAVIDEGTTQLLASAPTEEDARNISTLLTYAAAKNVCNWNEAHVLEVIQTQ
jgi:hypothetical protein